MDIMWLWLNNEKVESVSVGEEVTTTVGLFGSVAGSHVLEQISKILSSPYS